MTIRCIYTRLLLAEGAIVTGKLYYTSSAWCGFTSVDDQQHLDGFIRRGVRQGYCASNLDTVGIIFQADEKLFQSILLTSNRSVELYRKTTFLKGNARWWFHIIFLKSTTIWWQVELWLFVVSLVHYYLATIFKQSYCVEDATVCFCIVLRTSFSCQVPQNVSCSPKVSRKRFRADSVIQSKPILSSYDCFVNTKMMMMMMMMMMDFFQWRCPTLLAGTTSAALHNILQEDSEVKLIEVEPCRAED